MTLVKDAGLAYAIVFFVFVPLFAAVMIGAMMGCVIYQLRGLTELKTESGGPSMRGVIGIGLAAMAFFLLCSVVGIIAIVAL